ncbi:MAG: CBS domain-containing protein [Planctomycetes bacterium]|nr:CBS domain-containing protein [Planctomycetota bacterium]
MQIVADFMTSKVVTVQMDDTVATIQEIFDESLFHHLVVVKDRQVVGVISDRDLLKNISPFIGNNWMERKQDTNTLKKRAHQIMRRPPIVTLQTVAVAEAATKLIQEQVTCLPVVDEDGRLEGIVTWRDLMPHCFSCQQDRSDAA